MLRILGLSNIFIKKEKNYSFSFPKSSFFEYCSLADRLNKRLFFLFLRKQFSRSHIIANKFSFRLKMVKPIAKKRKLPFFIIYLRILSSYFKHISLRSLFKFFICALRKKGAYQANLIILFECRLVSIMYRLYFFYDFTDSLNFLKINPI
jgi:hypothetical protein